MAIVLLCMGCLKNEQLTLLKQRWRVYCFLLPHSEFAESFPSSVDPMSPMVFAFAAADEFASES